MVIVLSLTVFLGGILGAIFAPNISNIGIKQLFLLAVLGLAIKPFLSVYRLRLGFIFVN
ncbi:MAG: hypothetical protein I4E98_10390 [Planktothrix agardhii KL2]|uniref:hypothetical protein n=1 Tax=Planktothrix agardhii TaxID=1160 RepID=UPI001A1FE85B|nr:hypothetical protein [Planktothrix agardhii]MBG0746987.1 hypothetical protein [Planktothrix agardhii KL2]